MFDHTEQEVKPEAVTAAPVDPAELSDDDLDKQMQALWAHVHVAMGRAAALQAEINRRGLWHKWGARSAGHWLSWRAGLSMREANVVCRVADRLDECPGTKRALQTGEVSLAKAAAITRVANEATEDTLLQYARYAPTPELESITRAYHKVTEALCDEHTERRRRHYLRTYFDESSDYFISGRMAPEIGAVVDKALEAAFDRAATDPDADTGTRYADALGVVAERALEQMDPGAGSDRYQVVVHVSGDTLSEGLCEVEPGVEIAPETARRIACDAALVEMVETGGSPVSSRKKRIVPPRMRRALKARDKTCRWPGCTARGRYDAHHIVFWTDHGETVLENLVLLCRFHHRQVHEGGFTLAKDGDRFRFFTPLGKEIPPVPETEPPAGDLEGAVSDLGVAVDPDRTLPGQFVGETDVDLAVHCLLQDDRAAGRLNDGSPVPRASPD